MTTWDHLLSRGASATVAGSPVREARRHVSQDPMPTPAIRVPWRRMAELVACLVCVWLTGACAKPALRSFAASPRQYCPGTRAIRLTWSTSGRTSITAEPRIEGLGCVEPSGERSITPAPATIILEVSRLLREPESVRQRVQPVSAGSELNLGNDTSCVGNGVVALVDFEENEYDPAVVVTAIMNDVDRPIRVDHAGRSWVLPPDSHWVTLEADPGDPSIGIHHTWTLSAPLLPGEHCGASSAAAAVQLGINARLGCRPSTERSP